MSRDKKLDELLMQLSQPGELKKSLIQMDAKSETQRIYVMGCGRSGTWLLTTLFASFNDTALIPQELPPEYFGVLKGNASTLVLKRNSQAYERVEELPESINIIWIVRHPFDVLTSHHPMTSPGYHIKPWRLLGEMLALQYLIESKRSKMIVVKYEDLVHDPITVQNRISQHFDLSVKCLPSDLPANIRLPEKAQKAMHGLRGIDTKSVNRFKRDIESIEHIKKILPRIQPVLEWLKNEFSYDLSLA